MRMDHCLLWIFYTASDNVIDSASLFAFFRGDTVLLPNVSEYCHI